MFFSFQVAAVNTFIIGFLAAKCFILYTRWLPKEMTKECPSPHSQTSTCWGYSKPILILIGHYCTFKIKKGIQKECREHKNHLGQRTEGA
jgi:hypothetical protein